MSQPSNVEQPFVIPSKRTIWTIRLVVLGLIGIWIAGAVYLRMQVRDARAKVEQNRLAAQRQEQRLRRGAIYQQRVQEHNYVPATRNALDGRP